MTAFEHGHRRFAPGRGSDSRRFRKLAALGGLAYAAYAVAILGAPKPVHAFAFGGTMLFVPPAVWWGYARASDSLRRPVLLLAAGATLWLVGYAVWEAFYLAHGQRVPHPPGIWDLFLVSAQLLVIWALVVAMRSFISIRVASLDALVVTAAGIALAAPFIRHGFQDGVSTSAAITLNRPILSIVILMLICSAALRSWEGLPLAMAMLALAEAALTVGNLIYAFEAVQNKYVDARWASLAWYAGAIIALLGASTLILGLDQTVRFVRSSRIPDHAAGSPHVLLISLAALLLSCGVAGYGLSVNSRGLVVAGLAACTAIGAAMAFRATESIRTAESAYKRLDGALGETERAKDNLAQANAEIRTIQIAFADLLNLADERTHGRIRELIEDAGDDLAQLLEEEIIQPRHR